MSPIGIVGGDAVVAGQGQFEPSAQAGPVDGDDDGLRAGGDPIDHLLPITAQRLGRFLRLDGSEFFDIGSGDEVGGLSGAKNERTDPFVGFEFGEEHLELAPLIRKIEGDDRDPIIDIHLKGRHSLLGSARKLLGPFEDEREPHPALGTNGDEAKLHIPPLHLVGERRHHPRPGCPEWMPDSDRTTQHVGLFPIDFPDGLAPPDPLGPLFRSPGEFVRQHLSRKCFMDLDDAEFLPPDSGTVQCLRQLRTYASGSYPSASALSSAIKMTAAAPSVSGELLPAVTEPYRLSNAGLSLARASSEVSGRIPLSLVTTSPPSWTASQGAISAVNRPSAVAAAARWFGHLLGRLTHGLAGGRFSDRRRNGDQVAGADLEKGPETPSQRAGLARLNQDVAEPPRVQNRDLGQRLDTACQYCIRVSQHDLIVPRGNRLGDGARELRQETHLASYVRSEHRGDHLSEDDLIDLVAPEFCPVQQLLGYIASQGDG